MIMIPNFVCKPGAGASRVSRNAVNVVPCDCDHSAAGRAGAGPAPGAPGAGPAPALPAAEWSQSHGTTLTAFRLTREAPAPGFQTKLGIIIITVNAMIPPPP